jgi:dienelactone hydrolase
MLTSADWLRADRAPGSAYEPLTALNRWWGAIAPRCAFTATSPEAAVAWQSQVRAAVEAQLGCTPAPVPLVPRILADGELEPGVHFRFGEVDTAEEFTVPFMLLRPTELAGPTPAILCLHGHGDGMNPLFGRNAAGEPLTDEYQHEFALAACRRGFVVLTYDQLGFGRRRDFAYCARFGVGPCDLPSKLAVQLGGSMVGLRVFDARQMLSLLALQPEVDPTRLGIAGISGGGTISFFTAVLDERPRAIMLSGYFNRFADFMQVNHCIDNFVPGLASVGEMPDLGCALAPRALLISQGVHDPIFPLAATRAGVQTLRQAYRLLGAEERLEEEYYDDGHIFSNARVWDFMRTWL